MHKTPNIAERPYRRIETADINAIIETLYSEIDDVREKYMSLLAYPTPYTEAMAESVGENLAELERMLQHFEDEKIYREQYGEEAADESEPSQLSAMQAMLSAERIAEQSPTSTLRYALEQCRIVHKKLQTGLHAAMAQMEESNSVSAKEKAAGHADFFRRSLTAAEDKIRILENALFNRDAE